MKYYSGLYPVYDRNMELISIAKFAVDKYDNDGNYSTSSLFWRQLRSMWCAFCIRWDLMVDTLQYDELIFELYNDIIDRKSDFDVKFENFDDIMCELLV